MKYTLSYFIQGGRIVKTVLESSEEEARRQADAQKSAILLTGKPGWVKLWDENGKRILVLPVDM